MRVNVLGTAPCSESVFPGIMGPPPAGLSPGAVYGPAMDLAGAMRLGAIEPGIAIAEANPGGAPPCDGIPPIPGAIDGKPGSAKEPSDAPAGNIDVGKPPMEEIAPPGPRE